MSDKQTIPDAPETVPYEVFVRFTPQGHYAGGHVRSLRRIPDGAGGVIEQELDPEPITKAAIGDLFGANPAGLMEQADALAAAQAEAEAERDAARDTPEALQAQVDELRRSSVLTRDQMMAGMDEFGLLDPVMAFMAQLPDDQDLGGSTGRAAKLRWNTARYFDPQEPLFRMIALHPDFNLSDGAIEAMVAWARENA